MRVFFVNAFAAMLFASLAITASAQATTNLCGPLDRINQYGPYDYRTATPGQKHLVEDAHFTASVESLAKGHRDEDIGADIAYTLRVFPNHPRALYAMTRLAKRYHGLAPPGSEYPVECWYERAIRFRSDDPTVRVLYAMYLIEHKRGDEARNELKAAENTSVDPYTAYNLGLAYLRLGEYERALAFARKAYDEGVPFPGLRDELASIGKWRDKEKQDR